MRPKRPLPVAPLLNTNLGDSLARDVNSPSPGVSTRGVRQDSPPRRTRRTQTQDRTCTGRAL